MAIAPYLRRLRDVVGHDLLLLPSVAVLVWDDDGRLLLVRNADTGEWQTLGGAIEPDEAPEQAAVREAEEEAGVIVRLTGLRGVLGGPEFRQTYPNGDRVAYVPAVFDARVVGGELRPDGDETTDVRWWATNDIGDDVIWPFTRALLTGVGVQLA